MDAYKEFIFDEARQKRAKEVDGIVFLSSSHFDIINTKDDFDKKFPDLVMYKKGDVRHSGIIWERNPHENDYCSCKSYKFGNSEEWQKSHPFAFQCKHLHASRDLRYGGHP